MKKLTELQREQIKTAKLFLEEIRALAEQTERTLLTTTFIVNGKKYQYNNRGFWYNPISELMELSKINRGSKTVDKIVANQTVRRSIKKDVTERVNDDLMDSKPPQEVKLQRKHKV